MSTLIFNFDGTGNEPDDAEKFTEDESVSNVVKLHVLMEGAPGHAKSTTKTPGGEQQAMYYYKGIGTLETPALGRLLSKAHKLLNALVAPESGDAKQILEKARQDLDRDYKPGDTLAVFGFSRGAALARKFVSKALADNPQCEVSFLGVFDTVVAMDGFHREGNVIRTYVVLENGTLNERVKRAVHLVSLDENRVPFAPRLINKDRKNPERILEAWFSGVHGDVGGGYWFDGLSDITLQFMIQECKKALGERILIHSGEDNAEIGELFQQHGDTLPDLDVDDIVVNPISHGVVHEHSGLIAKAGGLKPRRVCVSDGDHPSKQEQDIPLLHHSVRDRFEGVSHYRPAALRGLKFKLLLSDGSITAPMHGISSLRESPHPRNAATAAS